MNVLLFRIYPAIPHHLVGIKIFFDDTQCIHFTTPTVILGTTMMCIGFTPHDVYTAGAYTLSGARPFIPEFKPAFYIFYRMAFHIAIVLWCWLTFQQRPF